MKLVQKRPCGCRTYNYRDIIPIEKLCPRHLSIVVREADAAEEKRARIKGGIK